MTNLGLPPFPPGPITAFQLADWIELWALSSRKPVTRGRIETTLQREATPNAEETLDLAWLELQSREQLFKSSWALKFEKDEVLSLRDKRRNQLFYYFLCVLSLESGVNQQGRALFEYCVADVVKAFGVSKSYRLGFPPNPQFAATFREAVTKYVELCGEKVTAPLLPTDKDLGLDVVAWFEMQDGRPGSLHLLGQCATGRDWDDKLEDLNLEVWFNHVQWAARPVRFFAIPHAQKCAPERWRRNNNRGGILLDRCRLVRMHEMAPLATPTLRQVSEYCVSLY